MPTQARRRRRRKAGLQPQGDARPRPAAARAKKRCSQGIEHARAGGKPADRRARSWRSTRATAQVLAIGSYPSFDPNKFAKPLTKSEYAALEGKAALRRRSARAADRPRRQRHLPDRLDVQADHRDGRRSKRASSTPSKGSARASASTSPPQQFCNAGKADYGAVGLVEALKVSSDTYFFEVGELANSHGDVIQHMARKLGVGQQTGHRPAERDHRASSPTRRGAPTREPPQELRCERRTHVASCGIVAEVAPVERRRQHAPGGRPGRPADLARCRWRWPTRRSPTPSCTAATARSCARTWAWRSTNPTGGLVQSLSFPPRSATCASTTPTSAS